MKVLLLSVVLVLVAVPVFSQSTPGVGAFGIGASLSGALSAKAPDAMSMSNGLNVTYFVTNNINLLGGFELATTSDVGTVFGFNLGGLYRFNRNQFTPVAGALILINVVSPSAAGAKSTTSFGFILGGGGEYYVSKNFGISLQEGLQFSTQPSTFGFVTKLGLNMYFGS